MKLYITETGVQLPPAPPLLYFSYSNFSIKAIIQFFIVFLLTLVLVTVTLLLPSTLLAELVIFVTRWDMK